MAETVDAFETWLPAALGRYGEGPPPPKVTLTLTIPSDPLQCAAVHLAFPVTSAITWQVAGLTISVTPDALPEESN